ncbi:MAG: hypothetical protein ACFCVE_04465 [Phycisphaerae bacterium]
MISEAYPSAEPAVPFHIESLIHYDDSERARKRVSFGPVGVAEPARLVFVWEEDASEAKLAQRLGRGDIDLPCRLIDALGYACYLLMEGEIREGDADSGARTMSDCSRWVRTHFIERDAEQIITEFRRLVPPGTTARDLLITSPDDNI